MLTGITSTWAVNVFGATWRLAFSFCVSYGAVPSFAYFVYNHLVVNYFRHSTFGVYIAVAMTFVSLHLNVLEEGKPNRKKEGEFPWLLSTIISRTPGIILIKKCKIGLQNIHRLFLYLEDYKNTAYSSNNTVFFQTLTFYALLYLYNLDNYTFPFAAPFCTPTAREHYTPVILQTETRPSCV